MKHIDITLDRLKQRNKIFFSPDTIKVHQDKEYKIDHNARILSIKTGHGLVHYKIGRNFELTYTNL